MNISIIGRGYVAKTIATCLANHGHDITNVEIDEEMISQIFQGKPVHELGLNDLLEVYVDINSQ